MWWETVFLIWGWDCKLWTICTSCIFLYDDITKRKLALGFVSRWLNLIRITFLAWTVFNYLFTNRTLRLFTTYLIFCYYSEIFAWDTRTILTIFFFWAANWINTRFLILTWDFVFWAGITRSIIYNKFVLSTIWRFTILSILGWYSLIWTSLASCIYMNFWIGRTCRLFTLFIIWFGLMLIWITLLAWPIFDDLFTNATFRFLTTDSVTPLYSIFITWNTRTILSYSFFWTANWINTAFRLRTRNFIFRTFSARSAF